jgi:hypothetical protein
MSSGGGTTHCSAYVTVRYRISKLSLLILLSCTVHQATVCPCWQSITAPCAAARFLCGTAAGCSWPGILPRVPYAVFAGLLPGLAVVLPRSCGEHVFMAMHNPGRHALFPGI